MSARKIIWTIVGSALLSTPCFSKEVDKGQSAPPPVERGHTRPAYTPSLPYQMLRTAEGLALLKQSTHPEARDILAALGEEVFSLPETITRELDTEADPREVETPVVSGPTEYGTRFNLEPRSNAIGQFAETIDFIPSGVASGVDLIVGSAFLGTSAGSAESRPPTQFST